MIAENLTTPLNVHAIVPAAGAAALGDVLDGRSRLSSVVACGFAAIVDEDVLGLGGRSRADLAPQLLAHQRAIEAIMQASPLLPVKFGTVVPDVASIRSALAQGAPAFADALSRLDGCVEMDVRVGWDVAQVFARIAQDEKIVRLKHERADAALIGRHVKQALERRRVELVADLTDELRAVAVDLFSYPVSADGIIVDLALLVKQNEIAAFERSLEALDTQHDGKLTFRCIGPMAPASFAAVKIEIVDGKAVEDAQALLGVASTSDVDEIRAGYHRLARKVHPDAAPEGSSARMAALADAARLLLHHAAQGEASPRVHVSVQRQEPCHDAGI